MAKVLIIIPAYNEEKNIESLVKNIRREAPECHVLVINDYSKDNTAEVCRRIEVDFVDLPANLGIGGAMQTGYKYAKRNGYDIAIQVDGDGQHDPTYIPQIIKEVKKGCNICIGSRFIEKEGFQSTFMRRVGIVYFTKLIALLTGKRVTDPTSGFRACDRKVIDVFSSYYPVDYPEPETIVLLQKMNMNIKEIPVVMKERTEGVSSIDALKSIYYMIKVTLAIVITSMNRYKESYNG